jgi:aerobic-type carbon monoxide dehydrogenase small subunit (CoxS/CutS family)
VTDSEQAAAIEDWPTTDYRLRVNGVDVDVSDAWIGESLLYVLRERLGLAGSKQGCGQGECGACTVLLDGRLAAACLVPAATARGRDVRTIEGVDGGDELPARVRRALTEALAVGCGSCVPGMVVSVCALLRRSPAPSPNAVREALSGNLCRCVATGRLVAAVREAADAAPRADAGEA